MSAPNARIGGPDYDALAAAKQAIYDAYRPAVVDPIFHIGDRPATYDPVIIAAASAHALVEIAESLRLIADRMPSR